MSTLSTSSTNWTTIQKLLFRLWFLYFATYIFFTPNNEIPLINTVYEKLNNGLHLFIPWFAKTFCGYHNPITIFTNGSGDTTYDYFLWLFGIVLTVIGSLIWSLLDRRRSSYNTLYYWIRVIIRFYLFYTMISYGMFKVIKLQFPFPYLGRLVEPYGDSSPMGLAWTYMGYSTTYNYFTGIAELLAGVLLVFRRTSTFGAMVCLGVMTNVFLINLSYDVPVKLLSFNTCIMCLFLLWKDAVRLKHFFISNKTAAPSNLAAPYTNKNWHYGLLVLKWVFVVFILWINIADALDAQKQYGDMAPKPPLYGIYYTDLFMRNNDTVPPLDTDTTRWKRIIIQRADYASVQLNNDSSRGYNFKVDSVNKKIIVYPNWDTLKKAQFTYTKDSFSLSMSGKMKNDSVYIRLKRFDENRFRLVNRGFHWVNEYPYNR
ncbi:MAG: DoxX family protein [Bacteroidetes bacterium]|nr:DoxX family protein [Bacteroidota bacterium]